MALTRAQRKINVKKRERLDSLESHITTLTNSKADAVSLQADLDELTAAIAAVSTAPKREALNNSALIVAIRATTNTALSKAQQRINAQRSQLSALNDVVQADGDYDGTEKGQFQTATDNEE
jgi:hypothetical protein